MTRDPHVSLREADYVRHSGRQVAGTAEEWRALPGYEGYEVSNFGRVRSYKKYKRPVILRQKQKDGYRFVCLVGRDGTSPYRPVHHLVLETFVGPRPTGMETRHLNDVGIDNRLENLRWGTKTENQADRERNGIGHKPRSEGWNR